MPTFGEVTKTLAVKRKTAQRSVPKGHRDNAPDTLPSENSGGMMAGVCAFSPVPAARCRQAVFVASGLYCSQALSRPVPSPLRILRVYPASTLCLLYEYDIAAGTPLGKIALGDDDANRQAAK